MNNTLKVVAAIVLGLFAGGIVNMLLVLAGPQVIPPPAGVNQTTMEGLKQSMHLMQPKHFIFPFLAHALGTLVGALVAIKIAPHKAGVVAIVIGAFNFLGGLINVLSLPSPVWFSVLDLGLAYFTMSFVAYKLSAKAAK